MVWWVGWWVSFLVGWFGFVLFGFIFFVDLVCLVWLVGLLVGWASVTESFQKLSKIVKNCVQNQSKNDILGVPEALGAQDGPKRDFDGCWNAKGRFVGNFSASLLGVSWAKLR